MDNKGPFGVGVADLQWWDPEEASSGTRTAENVSYTASSARSCQLVQSCLSCRGQDADFSVDLAS